MKNRLPSIEIPARNSLEEKESADKVSSAYFKDHDFMQI